MAIGLKLSAILVLSIFLVTLIASVPAEAKKWYEYIPFLEKLLGKDKDKPAPQPAPVISTCADSDGEKYYTKGKLTYTNNLFGVLEEKDGCLDGNVLIERVCNSQVSHSENYNEYSCPYGCLDGTCMIPEIIKIANIPDQEWEEDTTHRIDLRQFFYVPKDVSLIFTSTSSTNIAFSIENGVVTLTPKHDFFGEETISVSVYPTIESVSGKVTLNNIKLIVKSVDDDPKPPTTSVPSPTPQINQTPKLNNTQSQTPLYSPQPSQQSTIATDPPTTIQAQPKPTPSITPTPQTKTCISADFDSKWSDCINGWQKEVYTKKPGAECTAGEPEQGKKTCTSSSQSIIQQDSSSTQTPTIGSIILNSQPTTSIAPAPTTSTQTDTSISISPTPQRTCSADDFIFTWSDCIGGWQKGVYIKKAGSNCVGGDPGSARQTCVYIGGGPSGGPSAGGPFTGGPTSTITTVAGNGLREFATDGVQATQSSLSAPYNVRTDSAGNIYIADRGHVRVRKVDKSTGIITTVATQHASDIALDGLGNIYMADDNYNKVLKWDKLTGAITTIAGTGKRGYTTTGFSGDYGPATSATLSSPRAVAVDSVGNIYVSDFEFARVRKIDKSTGIITTVVGSSEYCLTSTDTCGDGSLATLAKLGAVNSIAFDSQDNMYITGSNKVRKIDSFTGIITTVAGTGQPGSSGDGGQATSAKLNATTGADLDSDGNIYIAENNGRRLRKVDKSTGIITTLAGTGEEGYSGDGGQAINARLQPFGIHVSQAGKIYIADARYGVIREIG